MDTSATVRLPWERDGHLGYRVFTLGKRWTPRLPCVYLGKDMGTPATVRLPWERDGHLGYRVLTLGKRWTSRLPSVYLGKEMDI